MSTCPDTEALTRLLEERLDSADRSEVMAHVEGCPRCQQALDEMAQGDLAEIVGLLPAVGEAGLRRTPSKKENRASPTVSMTGSFGNEQNGRDETSLEPSEPTDSRCTIDLVRTREIEPTQDPTSEPGPADDQTTDLVSNVQALTSGSGGTTDASLTEAGPTDDATGGANSRRAGSRQARRPDYLASQAMTFWNRSARAAWASSTRPGSVGLNRLVALKMIRGGSQARPDHLARFRIEAEAVARLRHPNIVQIYDIGEVDGLPFVSLELLEGGDLADRLAGTPQPGRPAAELLVTLARAIHAAHEAGIVHRDLKPANVLFTADGVPKITDFGLAKRLESDSNQTETGQIMGTPSYMAPEQARGHTKDVGPAADVYALGAILYEMLTGRPPFKGETPIETVRQVVDDEVVPPVTPRDPRSRATWRRSA